MKPTAYIKDRKFLIAFYFILMAFISSVMYLDGTVNISADNIIYINAVSIVFFFMYLTWDFLYQRNFYSTIHEMITSRQEDFVSALPEAKTNEQHAFILLLKQVYEQQNARIEALHERKREDRDFFITWIHEIKTPIAASRLIIDNSIGKPMDTILDKLENELDKIDGYVEQVLYYSRTDSFTKDYVISECNIEKVVKESVKKQAKLFIGKRIRCEMNHLDIEVLSDKKWLGFIVDQILSNSLKYTDQEGIITITGHENEKEKMLVIEDNGVGIKAEDIDRIFEKGFTGYSGRVYAKSTGFGLYLAKTLAVKLGHTISVESEEGKYTKMMIHFPKPLNHFDVT
ncbi:histidine kinase [Aneurinibacillus migulanus]|uniref:histidine kinase n=1 Tax=Aneurinibacillus migulanus TaxID=47500 RepID=A0A0D1WLK6_ANEMI|nr:sensor histidine kinase [Aneurinibacillus migulanus]KIV59510.1 histidine kinase [Aneurinibacillus migulanus]KIV59590.1 histidine kinase [Aneurinibacillus migulanus]KON93118.1 histidine kinase [Aneurinibacillus migulanus]KPD07547.1 histidine kinase [Aneurinibacillus migulanus]MED0890991.1 sensor histidine kinase [Aneurinibacillus migulanus]